MVSVAGQIEIAAPPEKVREVFLDFAKYPDWAHTHIKAISVASRREEGKLQGGDKLNVSLSGMNFSPVVNSNTAEEFSWTGSLPLGLFSGKHTFRFDSSEVTPGHTTFRDGEVFTGILTKVFGFMSSSRDGQTSKNFDAFDQELKKRVESLHGKGGQSNA